MRNGWHLARGGLAALLAFACGNAGQGTNGSGGGGGVSPGEGGRASQGGPQERGSSAGSSGGSIGTGGGAAEGGSVAGASHGDSAGAGNSCQPIPHVRPTPGAQAQDFSSLAASFIGVYQISDVYTDSNGCSAMCRTGGVVQDKYRYLGVFPESSGSGLIVAGCENATACTAASGGYITLGRITSAVSDRILESTGTQVQSPNDDHSCIGGSLSWWLVQSSADHIRLDVQTTLGTFAAHLDEQAQLWGCDGGDAQQAAFGKDCSELRVIDATRLK